jgi:hypothetical protein
LTLVHSGDAIPLPSYLGMPSHRIPLSYTNRIYAASFTRHVLPGKSVKVKFLIFNPAFDSSVVKNSPTIDISNKTQAFEKAKNVIKLAAQNYVAYLI